MLSKTPKDLWNADLDVFMDEWNTQLALDNETTKAAKKKGKPLASKSSSSSSKYNDDDDDEVFGDFDDEDDDFEDAVREKANILKNLINCKTETQGKEGACRQESSSSRSRSS